jgi:hypothetical protein
VYVGVPTAAHFRQTRQAVDVGKGLTLCAKTLIFNRSQVKGKKQRRHLRVFVKVFKLF